MFSLWEKPQERDWQMQQALIFLSLKRHLSSSLLYWCSYPEHRLSYKVFIWCWEGVAWIQLSLYVLHPSAIILKASDWPERLGDLANQNAQHPDGYLSESWLILTLNTEQSGTHYTKAWHTLSDINTTSVKGREHSRSEHFISWL